MSPEQRIAVLEATVTILKERTEKQEERLDKIEKTVGDKLDILISQSNFVKGILKAIGALMTALTISSPFIIKYFL